MKKIIVLTLMALFLLGATICFAEEQIYSCPSYDLYLLNAKTVSEENNIIKATIKEIGKYKDGQYHGYTIEKWYIHRNKNKVVLDTFERYDENGVTKGSTGSLGFNKDVSIEILSKIYQYIDREGK